MRLFLALGLLLAVEPRVPDSDSPPPTHVVTPLPDYQPEVRFCSVAAGGRPEGGLGAGVLAASAIMLGRHVRRGRKRR